MPSYKWLMPRNRLSRMQLPSGTCSLSWKNFKEVGGVSYLQCNTAYLGVDPYHYVHEQPSLFQSIILLIFRFDVSTYFSTDQSSELSQALKRSQTELASSIQESQQLKGEMEDLRAQLMEASSVAEAAAILNHELEEKEKKVAELTREGLTLHE